MNFKRIILLIILADLLYCLICFSFAVCLKWIKMRNNGIPCKDLVIDIAVPVMLWENQEALSCGVGSHYTSLLRSFLLFISYKVKNLSKHFLLFIATWIEFEMTWEKIHLLYIHWISSERTLNLYFCILFVAFQLKASPMWSPSVTPAVCGKDENILLVFISRCTMWE